MILKMSVTGSLLLGAAVLLACPIATSVAQDPKPSPKDILTRVEQVYATCRSYQDAGTVVMKNLAPDSKDDEEKASFTIVFVRPSSFRFDYQYRHDEKQEHYIIWANGTDVRTWWHRDPQREGKPESLPSALGAAAGVTHGASTVIPRLLLGAARKGERSRWTNGELKQLPDGRVDDKECTRIQRTFRAVNFEDGSRFDVVDVYWIEKATFLVRRLQTEMKDSKSAFRTTITYAPKINVDIPAKALEINPPAEK